MVHRKKGRKLKRTASHRRALLSNLSISLILNKRINTTVAKAKELRRFIEPLVSKAKKALKYKNSEPAKSIHLRREARKFLNHKDALNILFNEIGEKVGERPGGYTRVLKTGFRYGDGAQKAIIEFVDYNYVKAKEEIIKAKEDKANAKDGKDSKDAKEKETDVKAKVPKAKTVKTKEAKTKDKGKDKPKDKKSELKPKKTKAKKEENK